VRENSQKGDSLQGDASDVSPPSAQGECEFSRTILAGGVKKLCSLERKIRDSRATKAGKSPPARWKKASPSAFSYKDAKSLVCSKFEKMLAKGQGGEKR